MLYLGIVQHAKQLSISLRDGSIAVVQNRQLSTVPLRCLELLQSVPGVREVLLPTKTFPSNKAIVWLRAIQLPLSDRSEMNWYMSELERLSTKITENHPLIR